MRRYKNKKIYLILIAALFLSAFFIPRGKARAETMVSGFISGDEHWTQAQSPVIIDGWVYLTRGVKLIIDPGVVVKLKPGAKLTTTNGTIEAIGTKDLPIIFTSFADDTVGGDSNGDGDATMPQASDWDQVSLDNPNDQMTYAEFRYGQNCLNLDTLLLLSGVKAHHCVAGITASMLFQGTIENNEITDNIYGINILGASLEAVKYNRISRNTYGISFGGTPWSMNISNNDIFENNYGVDSDYTPAVLRHNNIYNNKDFGYRNNGSTIIDATDNWWGDISGPMHPTLNSGGLGNGVTDRVDFDPWIGEKIDNSISGPPALPTISISADHQSIASGSSATISWTSTDATSCDVDSHDGTSGSFSTGSLVVTTSYSGTCTGPGGSADGSVTVSVEEASPPDDSDPPPDEPSGLRPVVIIPGIMGTELYDGPDLVWPNTDRLLFSPSDDFLSDSLDLDNQGNSIKNITVGDIIKAIVVRAGPIPITNTDTFQTLINTLEDNGFTLNQNLFVLPYDWRLDLGSIKLLLKNKIQHIKDQTGFDKVDIIAHSMGGLLTEDYIKQYGSDSVNKLVFIGTPHLGAPKAANSLLSGDLGFPINLAVNSDRIKEIAQNSPAIYELLPSQAYFDAFDGYIRPWPTASEVVGYSDTTDFLSDLGVNSDLLRQAIDFSNNELKDINYGSIQVSNIVGCKMPTQNVYYVKQDGSIVQIRYGNGDGTVPFVSADDSPGTEYYVTGGKHVNLPSTAGVRELITNILTGAPENLPGNISQSAISYCGLTGKELNWRSPVKVQIHDASGNHAGPLDDGAIENNIPGASYDMIDGEAYIFLPTDEGQTYTIQGTGTATGTFDLIISDIANDNITNNVLFDNVIIIPGSSISFSVSQNSDDSQINLDFNNSGNSVNVAASNQFADQTQALVQAMSVPAPPPVPVSSGGSSGVVVIKPENKNNGKILGQTTSKLADGTLALDTVDGRTVYMIGNNGKKYGFTSESAFRGLGFKFDLVLPADLSSYELGGFVSYPDEIHPNGSLIFDGQTVWFIDHEKRFGFSSLEQFELNGFDPKQIVPANPNDMFLAETNLLNN